MRNATNLNKLRRSSDAFAAEIGAMNAAGISYFWRLVWLRAYRDRRRIAFVVSLAFVAGYVLYLRHGGQVLGVPVPVFTGLVYAVFIGLATLLTGVILPGLRFATEAIAVSRLILALVIWTAPALAHPIMSQPLISATIVVGGAVLLQRLVYGGWLDALFGRDILQTNRAAEWLDDSLGRIADQATLGGFTAEKLHNPEQTAIAA